MRTTKHRGEIEETLRHHHGAVSASELHALLPHINLVTIYRNLETFAAAGLIKKLYLDGNEAKFEYQEHPHYHAVCGDCARVIHFDIKTKDLSKVINIPNFTVGDIELVVHGVCAHAHSTKQRLT